MARVERQAQNGLHRRVLDHDPTAKADIFGALLDPLIDALGYRWPKLRGSDSLRDQAIDSVFNYLAVPERYDPQRCSLLTYLRMDAHMDLINAYRSLEHAVKVVPLPDETRQDVSLRRATRKVDPALVTTDTYPSDSSIAGLIGHVIDALPNKRDRDVVALMIQGERSSNAFAQVLGLDGVQPEELERRVNREKDRIRKKLRRTGARHEKERGA